LELREQAKQIIDKAAEEAEIKVETNDKDYVFIHFILNNLPKGLIGLLLAVILSAAMSSTASELNALASTTALDLYKRNTSREITDLQMVHITKWFTLAWGILAIVIACVAYLADNLIQLVNIIGSIFYGNVLGIFLLGFFFKHIRGNAVFVGAIITQIIVFALYFLNRFEIISLPYLWLNFVGCVSVIVIAHLLQSGHKKDQNSEDH
jgi:SSS family solute:Na+ symporter